MAGEIYNGGAGTTDVLFAQGVAGLLNLSNVTLAGLEILQVPRVALKAAQLDAFTSVSATEVTLTTGGFVHLSGANVSAATFNLHSAGNVLTTNVSLTAPTVNGGAGNDNVTLTGNLGGSVVNGNGGNDTLTGNDGGEDLNGGAGSDVLNGRGGSGDLAGGTDANIFLFTNSLFGALFSGTTITDFSGITAFGGGAGEGDKICFVGSWEWDLHRRCRLRD